MFHIICVIMKIFFLSLFLLICGHAANGQLTGGRENGQKAPSASEPGKLSGGIYSGDVNIFTGEYQSSIPLGSVSTPAGMSYSLELSHGSSFSFGSNESAVKGLLYGDGWNLNIPVITVSTDIFHRFGNGAECNDNNPGLPSFDGGGNPLHNTNVRYSDYPKSWEGDVFWFEPYVSIPGVGSGRAVFKYVDVKDADCAVFVLNKFSTPIELRFYGSSWSVIAGDGTMYVFEGAVQQFAAPSNKRQQYYDNLQNNTYDASLPGTKVLVDNKYGVDGGIPNVIEPKLYYNSWYCTRILNRNYYGQAIVFEYERHGAFNFYQEFRQNNYAFVHKDVFEDLTSKFLPDYTAYREILLKRIISSALDENIDILELEYDIDESLAIPALMTPGVGGAVSTDPMYCSKVVKRFDGTSANPYSGWHRYPHANRSGTMDPQNILSNPYLSQAGNYVREGVTAASGSIPFDHGFLESQRIQDAEAMVAGDLYEIRTRVTRSSGTDLRNGNGTLDIAIVTNGDPDAVYTEPSLTIPTSSYHTTRGEQLFSTFNMAMKWQMGHGETSMTTSNLFMMPDLPPNFKGFNIQVGPGNNDMVNNYYSNELYLTLANPTPIALNKPNAMWAYPQLKASSPVKSSGSVPRHFGTGHPWGMMFPVYNFRALAGNNPLTGSPASHQELYIGTWSMSTADVAYHGVNSHNPTKFNNSVKLESVELVRHGRTAYMLKGVKQYRMDGLYGGPVLSGKQLVAQKRLVYTSKSQQIRRNRTYTNGIAVGTDGHVQYAILLKAVHEVPVEGNLYASGFGLVNPKVVLTTELDYANPLPASGTYSEITPYTGLAHYALVRVTDNLGGVTDIEYYPVNHPATRTYATSNFNWNCGTYLPASYGAEKSYNMNLSVKHIKKTAADYDEVTHTFVPSMRVWDYVYDTSKKTFNFKRISTPSLHFRGMNPNHSDRGFAKVTVYEPALVTGERNYTVHEFFGKVSSDLSYLTPTTIEDYLYYGKQKSTKSYDHLGIIHSEKIYQYTHTLAFEDGYGRPHFYRDNLNHYVQPVTDGYEYRDYYKGEAPTLNIGSEVLTGDAAKTALGGMVKAIGGGIGNASLEHPKYLPFFFFHQLRQPSTLVDVNGTEISTFYSNPEYVFNSYFVKLASETERVYEDGLTKKSSPPSPGTVITDSQPVLPNPFGGGITPPVFTSSDSLALQFMQTQPAQSVFDLLMGMNSISDSVLGRVLHHDHLSLDQKTDILSHLGGLSNATWFKVIQMHSVFSPAQLQRMTLSQPYFSDTIQKFAISSDVKDYEFLTALLTRNSYLSDDVIGHLIKAHPNFTGISYEQTLAAQPHFLTNALLTDIVNNSKLNSGNLLPILRIQQLPEHLHTFIVQKPSFSTTAVYDLFMEGGTVPSDSVLFRFFSNRTITPKNAQDLVDRCNRPFPTYLKLKISGLHPSVTFTADPLFNPLSAYCSNAINMNRTYIETKTDYEYYEANYKGIVTNKAYELLLGMISHIDEPSSFPKTFQLSREDSVLIPHLQLKYEPSWQLASKKVTSPHLPGAYQREEYFYLYDLQNRYARHWMHYDIQDNQLYTLGEYGIPTVTDTFAYFTILHSDYTNPNPPLIPEFDGMTKSRQYNLRSIPFQKTVISKNAAESKAVSRSEYYHYDARWKFNDLYEAPVTIPFVGDTCISAPVDPGCDCIYENHIFGESEFNQMMGRYPLSSYCYHHIGGDGTGWQYSYWVCPKNVNAPACFDGITSTICSEADLDDNEGGGEGPLEPNEMVLVGAALSETLQLRSVSVQVDTLDLASKNSFKFEKWDRKNRYIAEFALDGVGIDANGFAGFNYRMVLPFISLKTEEILERNRYMQVKIQEDATGLKTRYYFDMPEFFVYKNTRCPADQYSMTHYRSTALPIRITTGYERNDSLSTSYTYTAAAQVDSITDANGVTMAYAFDGFHRLTSVTELNEADTLLLSETYYHIWERNAGNGFMERAAQNYVDQRTYNSDIPSDFSFTRSYVDPLGRSAGMVTSYVKNGRTQHIRQGSVLYDKWNRAQRQFKNTLSDQGTDAGKPASPSLLFDFSTPFTESELENTPKSRARKAAGFGIDLSNPASKTVRTSYAIANNVYTSCELGLSLDELHQVMSPGSTNGFRFFRTETLDQDDHKTVTYTNAFGQTVGTVAYIAATNPVITLFVYDNQGNLTKVINPKKQVSTYEYNLLGQLFRENTPDAGEKKYMYNKRGQVSYMLDQQLWTNSVGKIPKPYYRSFSYDAYGRPTEVKLTTGPGYTRNHKYGFMHYKTEFYGVQYGTDKYPVCNNEQAPTECAYFDYQFSHRSTQDWLVSFQVTQRELHPSYHENIQEPITVTLSGWENGFPYATPVNQTEKQFIYGNYAGHYERGKLSETRSYNNNGQEVLRTQYSYNERGQVKRQAVYFNETPQTVSDITTVTPSDIHYPHYSLQGLLLKQEIDVQRSGTPNVFLNYSYDALGRLKAISTNDQANGINTKKVVGYEYDDALGVLASKNHELDKQLVNVEYAYDVQQRLNAIQALNQTTSNPQRTLVRHQYYYDNQVPYHNFGSGLPPQFGFNHNGNINGMLSSYDFEGTYGSAPSLFQYPVLYGYTYDHLNRLVQADGTVGDFVTAAPPEQLNQRYQIGDEHYTYDKIGNILQLTRKRYSHPENPMMSEGWYYNYPTGNNRLISVSGMAGTQSRGYSYDPNGNLLTDNYRGIMYTQYGRAAYPYFIDAANGVKISYLYSTDDQRMYKKVEGNNGTTTEFYLQDMTGKTVAVRTKTDTNPAQWEYYINGAAEREAKLTGLDHAGGIQPHEIEFYLYDHLGNTRVVYGPTVADGRLELDIRYVADYFPYGKILREYVNTNSGDPEKFLTTQHERDQETGFDYRGARFYDSDIARFLSLDPHATKYPSLSPYNYLGGMPTVAIDPDGKDIIIVVWTTGTGNNGVGHAGIAVSNYKQETYMETVNGIELERTRMVADGTYTFYDNWPGGSGVNFDLKGALTSVEAHRNITLIGSESEFTNGSTVSPSEQVAPDGVLKLSTSYEQDMAVKGRLDNANDNKKDYNGAWYNCSSYASDGLKGVFGKKVGRESMLGPVKSITPNQLWKDTKETAEKNNIGTDVLKDPGAGVDNKFKETMKGGN